MAFFEIYVCKVKSSRKRGAAETMTSRYRFTAATGHCGTIIGQVPPRDDSRYTNSKRGGPKKLKEERTLVDPKGLIFVNL